MEAFIFEARQANEQIVIDVPENLRGKTLKVVLTEAEQTNAELTLEEKKAILAKNKGSMPATLDPQIDLEEEWYLQ
ncbi:hypothetical protein ACO2Q8_00780 [Larkinella sp. VNQ87]|uniref:hypothetical protein n=1 Tax=Larkinella sp. VNQ87 TaxID=3400921 RepID=UPI003C107AC3